MVARNRAQAVEVLDCCPAGWGRHRAMRPIRWAVRRACCCREVAGRARRGDYRCDRWRARRVRHRPGWNRPGAPALGPGLAPAV